jgi:PAS domain S-box-containing protein
MNRKTTTRTLGQSLYSVRLLAAMFVVSSVTLQFIYNKYLPNFVDPDSVRWGLNIMVGLLFISTFIIRYSTKYLDYISLVIYSLILSYTIYLTLVNNFHPFAVTLVILVIGGGTIILTNMNLYWIQSAIVFFLTLTQFIGSKFSEEIVLGIFNIVVTIPVFGVVLFVRLKMIEEVGFSNSLLEKVQSFSIIANPAGQIVFVSPSIKSILGYSEVELLKEGWWKNKNTSVSWIEKEHILNFPGVIREEIKTKEIATISSDGRTVLLSWTTSILPDGNYIGVALDITKYKSGRPS